jgi:hypothetical protein
MATEENWESFGKLLLVVENAFRAGINRVAA